MKNSIIIALFFIAGILLGRLLNPDANESVQALMQGALYALMLFVGLSFGSDPRLMEILKSFKLRLLLLPLLTLAGTFLGIGLYVLIFSEPEGKDSFAIASGFGYYSLSSIIISGFSGSEIAVIALLSNVLREIITLLFTPLMVRFFGPTAPICSAGATSMDTTLPVIVKSSGKDLMVASLFHGIVLTLLVPVLITFIYKVF